MKIRFHGKAGELHSWCEVTKALACQFEKLGNEVFIKSTDGLEHFPKNMEHMLLPGYHNYLVNGPADYFTENRERTLSYPNNPMPEIEDKNEYDIEGAYTILMQGCRRFKPSTKLRFLVWNFESSILPPGWYEYHRAVDYIFPSSQFSFDIFANNGIPKEKMLVVPHGVDTNAFNPDIAPYPLKTKKKVKFLHNAIQHARKCHDRVIKGYLDAFTSKDDVCLVLKTKFKTPDADKPFEVNVKEILESLYPKYSDPPEIEIINNKFIENIGSLYTACDVVVSMSSTEGFWCPGIESLACNRLVIAPHHGGQLDFLNDNNSLLVNTKEMYAPISHQYWCYNPKAIVGDPDVKHFTELLRYAYENFDKEKERVKIASAETVKKFSWENSAKMILDLPIPSKSRGIPDKRKVLYIVPYAMCGGAEVWIKNIINGLNRSVYEPHIAFVNGITEELKKLFDGCAKFEDLSIGNFESLKCMLESENYSIIHFYNSFNVYNSLRHIWSQGYRVRILETVHSELNWNDSMMKVSTRDPIISMIISVSNTLAQKLNSKGNKNIVVYPQQINWNRFKLDRNKDILDKYNIPKDFVVGFVGRLSPEKNVIKIIQYAKSLPDVSFVIVGDGPQEKVLKSIAPKNVYFVGRQQDVEKFYISFDVLLLTSVVEGLPLVILEAMTSGTPIITSNVGAISEIIKNEYNGFIINSNNNEEYIKAIVSLKDNNLWQTYSKNCTKITEEMERVYKNVNINSLYDMLYR